MEDRGGGRGASELVETHTSTLFFVGDRVYKLKKPVAFDFVDLSTREAREAICHREVELNRRLSPDVYLGVADVLDPDGRPFDHLVIMRRLPEDRRLATMVRAGIDTGDCIRSLARLLAAFHARVPTTDEISEAGRVDAVRRRWDDCFATMEAFVGPVLDKALLERAQHLAHRYLDGRTPLFSKRIADGRIRDGHGDLLADDIFCLDDGPRVLDCIEFDDRLRHGDVLADVAFLAMDLERLGARRIGELFLSEYRELAGERFPMTLSDHYVAHRAQVRSMVACLRWQQGDAAAADAASHLARIAVSHLERGRVVLALVGGLPGTGKTTLADALADRIGWSVLHSDEVRKDIAGLGHRSRASGAYEGGIYTPDATLATYRELLVRARRLLERGEPVIIDASWTNAELRATAAVLGRETASDLVEIRCIAPADVAASRLARRARQSSDASDATPEVAERMARSADPWPSATTIDTGSDLADSVDGALSVAGVPAG